MESHLSGTPELYRNKHQKTNNEDLRRHNQTQYNGKNLLLGVV